MMCRMKSLAAFVLGAGLLLASAAPAQIGASGYTIGPRDLLELQVYEVPELNVQRRVTENGIVRLPLLGDVPVQGLTVPELIDSLERLLEETYVERASVNVEVLEFRSRPISIIGAVREPGDLGLPTGWTLLEAISAAGGLAESHGDRIHVLRRASNGLTDQISIPLDALMTRADPRANIPLFANDLIHVEPRTKVNVYCLGEIASPGALAFDSTERITVLSAIARAGGLTDRASSKIVIRRPGEGGQVREIEVSYKRILAGKEPDPPLQDGDMLVVKESFF
mgnify:CR=1 FL=1